MALTRDLLTANAVLAALTEEQVNAIVNLSANDENSVIAKRIGEIYSALDADVFSVTGIAKNGTEKTYDYTKRVLGEYKQQISDAESLNKQIATLTKEKEKLEKQVANGISDEETQKRLKRAESDLANITKQYNELNDKYQAAETEHAKAMFNFKLDNELQAASSGIKFKAGLPEAVTKVLLQQAYDKVKSFGAEYIEDGKGGKMLVFKDGDGIKRNPSNQMYPYTAAELVTEELQRMDVLQPKQSAGGSGSSGGFGGGGNSLSFSARTQCEASDMIAKSLMERGLVQGSEEYQKEFSAAWEANNVKSLPIQ